MRFLLIFQLLFSSIFILNSYSSEAADEAAPYWSYDDDYNGQEDWGALKGYEVCRNGFSQSPVNIGYTKLAKLPKLEFQYKKSTAYTSASDKSLISTVVNGGSLTDGNKTYNLKTIEIHSPSGHHIKEKYFPFEIHLIHKDKDNNTLILAVLAKIQSENTAFTQIIESIGQKTSIKSEIDASSFLPGGGSYYSYIGSLPYPPCTEGVQWRIMKEPITLSKQQMTAIVSKIGRNTRLTQPLYMREVLESEQ